MLRPSPSTTNERLLNDRLDWNLLRWFLVMVQEGSLSRAAARLFVTQSAVSQALRRLEEQVGCTLVERRGHRFDLTKAGENTVRAANDMYGNISRLGNELQGGGNEIIGRVSIPIVSRIHSSAFDEFLAYFHKRYPLVRVEILIMPSSQIISSLLRKTATAGLAVLNRDIEKLESETFLRQRYNLFCGRHHRLYGRSDIDISDLTGEDFVAFTSEQLGDVLSPLTVFRDQKGFVGKIVATSPSLDEIARLIFSGFGIGCLPQHIGADLVMSGRLWQLPPEEGVANVDVNLMWHVDRKMNRAETAFLNSFRQFMMPISFSQRLGRAWEHQPLLKKD